MPGIDKLGHLFENWKNFISEAYYTNQSEIYICEIHFESNQIVKGKPRDNIYFKRLNDSLVLYLLNLEPHFNTLFQIYIDKD